MINLLIGDRSQTLGPLIGLKVFAYIGSVLLVSSRSKVYTRENRIVCFGSSREMESVSMHRVGFV
jgi:hypothetical protein